MTSFQLYIILEKCEFFTEFFLWVRWICLKSLYIFICEKAKYVLIVHWYLEISTTQKVDKIFCPSYIEIICFHVPDNFWILIIVQNSLYCHQWCQSQSNLNNVHFSLQWDCAFSLFICFASLHFCLRCDVFVTTKYVCKIFFVFQFFNMVTRIKIEYYVKYYVNIIYSLIISCFLLFTKRNKVKQKTNLIEIW